MAGDHRAATAAKVAAVAVRSLAPPSTPGVPSAAPRGAYTRATARCCHTKDVRVRTSRRVTHAPSAAAMLHAPERRWNLSVGVP